MSKTIRKKNQPRTLYQSFTEIYSSLESRRKYQLLALLVLMVVVAVSEVFTIGAVVPFLAVLLDAEAALDYQLVKHLLSVFGLEKSVQNVRLAASVLFACAAVVCGLLRFLLVVAAARVNFGIGHELASSVYKENLNRPYEYHISTNTGDVLGSLAKVDLAVVVFSSALGLVSGLVISLFIVAILVSFHPAGALSIILGLGVIYGALVVSLKSRLRRNGSVLSRAQGLRLTCVSEGLGGIRDIVLDKTHPVFLNRFSVEDWKMRQAQISNAIIGPTPRFFIEAIGMVAFVVFGYLMVSGEEGGGAISAIPLLGALALGAQRLMPLAQQIFQGYVAIAGNRQVIVDLAENLKPSAKISSTEDKRLGSLVFENEVCFNNVSYRYPSAEGDALVGVSFTIGAGQKVGVVGATGCGKSTSVDLLMGLLPVSSGTITVDGEVLTDGNLAAWQSMVSHVPQHIYIADSTFAENIAFGIEKQNIDVAKVIRAAKAARIHDFIETRPNGYDGIVGERGVQLSGGQRQRLGIARALYKDASVIVFDEATSALDSETEKQVMHEIFQLGGDYTLIIIAHRLNTLESCDLILNFTLDGVVAQSAL